MMDIQIFHLIEGARQAEGLTVIIDVFRAFSMECWLYALGARVVHTTSAGTQGIVNAYHAKEILTGSFVNAAAVAAYIRKTSPGKVSLVCMGKEGLEKAEEDELCAEYLKGMLTGNPVPDIDGKLKALRFGGGKHFFDPDKQEIYPEADFGLCIDRDRFDFVLRIGKDRDGFVSERIRVI